MIAAGATAPPMIKSGTMNASDIIAAPPPCDARNDRGAEHMRHSALWSPPPCHEGIGTLVVSINRRVNGVSIGTMPPFKFSLALHERGPDLHVLTQAYSRLSPPIGHDVVDMRPAANAATATVATKMIAPTPHPYLLPVIAILPSACRSRPAMWPATSPAGWRALAGGISGIQLGWRNRAGRFYKRYPGGPRR
jgi:hypothetical protein